MARSLLNSIVRRARGLKRRLTELGGVLPTSGADEASINKIVDELDRLLIEAQDLQRSWVARQRKISATIANFDGGSQLNICVMSPNAPWRSRVLEKIDTPTMISHEEAQYYDFIGAFYDGIGRALELGSWIGGSTQYIVRGHITNPRFSGQRLHVVDDFIWRASWMNSYAGGAYVPTFFVVMYAPLVRLRPPPPFSRHSVHRQP
jgi:hypothetical protein